MLKKIFIISMLSIFVSSFFAFLPVKAGESTGLIVSPPTLEKTINKGEKASGTIKLTNASDNELKITVSKKDFQAKDEEGHAQLVNPKENSAFSLAGWITITDSFTLKAKELKEVNYTINIPSNAEPGGHYGSVLFTPTLSNPATINGSGTTVASQIGVLMLITVPGEINYGAKVAEFSSNKKIFFDSNNTIQFISRLQNLSTVHIKPSGTITIKNMLGKNSVALVVNENEGNILPGSIRKFTNDWQKKYGFGFYKTTLSLTYDGNKNVTSSLIFWIIPWKETLIVVIILLMLAWVLSKIQWKKR